MFLSIGINFELENIYKRALRSLDLRTQHSLMAHIHRDEKVRVRQNGRDPIESAECMIGFGQQPGQFPVHFQRRDRRKWGWDKSPVSIELFYIFSCSHIDFSLKSLLLTTRIRPLEIPANSIL